MGGRSEGWGRCQREIGLGLKSKSETSVEGESGDPKRYAGFAGFQTEPIRIPHTNVAAGLFGLARLFNGCRQDHVQGH